MTHYTPNELLESLLPQDVQKRSFEIRFTPDRSIDGVSQDWGITMLLTADQIDNLKKLLVIISRDNEVDNS